MLTKELKTIYRSRLFRHLDGIVVAPSAYELYDRGVFELIIARKSIALNVLSEELNANDGYLNVALHCMASQGWIDLSLDSDSDNPVYAANAKTSEVLKYLPLYRDVTNLLKYSENFHKRKFERQPFEFWLAISRQYIKNFELSEEDLKSDIVKQILAHIEGILVGPTIVALGMSGMFHKYFMEISFMPEEFHEDAESFGLLLDFFVQLDWFKKHNGTYKFTDKGLFYAKRAAAYGVTVSYIPTMRNLDQLIFGNPEVLWNTSVMEEEKHVDRAMNVWGSGGAHAAYFKKVDEILIDIFNAPLQEQPKGILDMGCGNGAFLEHVFTVIEHQTLRGKHLDDHPLFLVGADFNKAAIEITRKNLIKADIWAKVIWGDIGDPDGLANKLSEDYNIRLEDLLNVRTFLDHNRVFESPPQDMYPDLKSNSKGAFAYRGKRIDNAVVERSLIHHFIKWKPYIQKHGLLLIELHTIAPSLISRHLGQTAATAYNATHGYSDQYILELDVFRNAAQLAGLKLNDKYGFKFPNSELATISINLIGT